MLAEFEQLRKDGYGSVYFVDDHFLLQPKRIEAICDGLIAAKLGFGPLDLGTGAIDFFLAGPALEFGKPCKRGFVGCLRLIELRAIFPIFEPDNDLILHHPVALIDTYPCDAAGDLGADLNLVMRDNVAGGDQHCLLAGRFGSRPHGGDHYGVCVLQERIGDDDTGQQHCQQGNDPRCFASPRCGQIAPFRFVDPQFIQFVRKMIHDNCLVYFRLRSEAPVSLEFGPLSRRAASRRSLP